jgi:ubiquinone/menaquinone biosynthesis C-methylase UbiE
MPPVFWTGKLSPSVKFLMNANGILAWLNGAGGDTVAMKERVKSGYNGKITDSVQNYDKFGLENQVKAAKLQMESLQVAGKEVLDIGAGTGALSFMLLEQGAKKVTCGDISEYMLDRCRDKAKNMGLREDKINFRVLDAESLPYGDNSYDAVVTGMSFGLFPDQQKAVNEMVRVVKRGGPISIGVHGPEHYWEPIDAFVRSTNIFYIVGYRPEFWPRDESDVQKMMAKAGISNIKIRRIIWRNEYASGGDAWDFFAAISGSMQYSKYPPEKRQADYHKVRDYFNKHKKNFVTDDVILAYGVKQ